METSTQTTTPFWIDGRETTAGMLRYGDVYNPATGEVTRRVPFASSEEVDAAVKAARRAFPSWRDTTPLERARVLSRFRQLLQQHRDQLARIICDEHGKTIADAAGSVQRGIEVVEFATGAPHLLKGERSQDVGTRVDCHSVLEPLGVCTGITPFNFPVMVPLWMFPMAIACGNAFILKPSEKVPSASVEMARLFRDAGLPDGVFNVIHGDKTTVDLLLKHPDINAISFVGSTPVARHVYATAAAAGKRVQALGGAKNHAVVMPDADVGFAADSLVGAAFGSAGQRCMSISAVVAVGDVGDRLVETLVRKASLLKVGPGLEPDVMMGPLITREHRDRVRSYIDSAVSQGATLVLDGRSGHPAGSGFFVGPTIFDRVSPEMTVYQDEVFGPVLIVLRARTLDEAIAMVNRNPYGNGTAIFTQSGPAASRFEREIEVGMVGVNVPIPVPMAFFSFGGWKSSLFGDLHVHGTEGVAFYTRTKVVTSRWGGAGAASSPSLSMPVLSEERREND